MPSLFDRIRDSLIRATAPSRECAQIGPFFAMLTRDDDMYWLNYAVPTSSEDPASSLDELEAHFRTKGRRPRFEFFAEQCPLLAPELVKRGYTLQGEMPAMVCRLETFRPAVREGISARLLDETDDLAALAQISWTAFDNEGSPPAEQCENTRKGILEGRMRAALALCDGVPAGGAYCVGDQDVTELAGVGTAPPFRRRGVASVASSLLMAEHFRNPEGFVWLSAGDETAKLVYEQLGFEEVGVQLNYIQD